MCVLLSLEPRYFHRLALRNKNKARESLLWRLRRSVAWTQIEVALFRAGGRRNRIQNVGVLGGMQSNNHCRLRRQGREASVSRPERLPPPPDLNQACRENRRAGPRCPLALCLWNTQEGTKVTALRDARRTRTALGNVSPTCERAPPPRGCLPAWEPDGKGRGSDNRPSVR